MNLALNYAYDTLEGECRAAINTVGLEPSVGFLHEPSDYQTKQSLVYDLQEPYRWLVDTTVITCLEQKRFGKRDFYRMDNYVLRLTPEAARRLIDALRIKFNSAARYKGRFYSWDTLIRLKAQELANHILGRWTDLNFSEPKSVLHRTDSEAIRNRILSMTTAEARNLGIRKSTLWYLKARAQNGEHFEIYAKVAMKLRQAKSLGGAG